MDGFVWCAHCGSPHSLATPSCPKTGGALAVGKKLTPRGLAVGTVVGDRYRIRAFTGDESISRLYDTRDQRLGRRVLLRHVDESCGPAADIEAELVEMERGTRAANAVDHPNVDEVLDFARLGARAGFLVRPIASRQVLAKRLRITGVMPADAAGDMLRQILSGLHALHGAGIVHRDLGAHTVAVVECAGCAPVARICGLGRCRVRGQPEPTDAPSGVHYTAPEVLEGAPADERSDIYSCGVLLFEMLTGRRPFEAPTPDLVRRAILADAPPSASMLTQTLDPSWLDVLEHTLAKDPAQRYPSALDLQAALPATRRALARRRSTEGTGDLPMLAPEDTIAVDVDAPPRSRRDVVATRCDPNVGRLLAGKYRIETLLGSGSSGAVYKAFHQDLRRPVAVKVLHERNRGSKQFVERFRAEAVAASKLDHPTVTRVLDCGQERDGTLFFVMEFVEGETLESRLAAEGRLAQRRAVDIAIDVATALVFAHGLGIIHRDIKPENIMLPADREGSVLAKVCDFGLARAHGDAKSEELTGHGVVIGSPAYMSPEQVRGLRSDERSDVYSLGATLYEMLTGRLPHEGTTLDEVFRLKVVAPPTPPSSFVEIDPLTEDVLLRALALEPSERHASARELRIELMEVITSLKDGGDRPLTVSIWPEPASEKR